MNIDAEMLCGLCSTGWECSLLY